MLSPLRLFSLLPHVCLWEKAQYCVNCCYGSAWVQRRGWASRLVGELYKLTTSSSWWRDLLGCRKGRDRGTLTTHVGSFPISIALAFRGTEYSFFQGTYEFRTNKRMEDGARILSDCMGSVCEGHISPCPSILPLHRKPKIFEEGDWVFEEGKRKNKQANNIRWDIIHWLLFHFPGEMYNVIIKSSREKPEQCFLPSGQKSWDS